MWVSLSAAAFAVAVFVFLAVQGWWVVFAVLLVLSVLSGLMAWRAGLPLVRPPEDPDR